MLLLLVIVKSCRHDRNQHVEDHNVGQEGGQEEENCDQLVLNILPERQVLIRIGALETESAKVAQNEQVLVPYALHVE